MQRAPRPSRTGLYIAIIVVALVVIGGIVMLALVVRFLNSEGGKSLREMISTTEKATNVLPPVLDALETYQRTKGDFPDNLDALSAYGAPEGALREVKAMMQYTKPAKDAPPDTVIMQSPVSSFMDGHMRIQVTKDLQVVQVTISPLIKREENRQPKRE